MRDDSTTCKVVFQGKGYRIDQDDTEAKTYTYKCLNADERLKIEKPN